MANEGGGSPLALNGWAFAAGWPLPLRQPTFEDEDAAEQTIWLDWFYEAPAPPAGDPEIALLRGGKLLNGGLLLKGGLRG